VIAFVLALIGAVAKLSNNGLANAIASFYTSFFRGVPLLIQIYLIYLGLPQLGYVVDAVPAGILALSLCYGAYMTEIFRAGIQSIPVGQWEASRALGISPFKTLSRVIMPQALRVIIPPTGNQFIAMLKDSSLVSVIGVWELMYLAKTQGRADFRHLEMLITAAMIYWALSFILERVQARIENGSTDHCKGLMSDDYGRTTRPGTCCAGQPFDDFHHRPEQVVRRFSRIAQCRPERCHR
jgi:polar amino acid transport system permease protein